MARILFLLFLVSYVIGKCSVVPLAHGQVQSGTKEICFAQYLSKLIATDHRLISYKEYCYNNQKNYYAIVDTSKDKNYADEKAASSEIHYKRCDSNDESCFQIFLTKPEGVFPITSSDDVFLKQTGILDIPAYTLEAVNRGDLSQDNNSRSIKSYRLLNGTVIPMTLYKSAFPNAYKRNFSPDGLKVVADYQQKRNIEAKPERPLFKDTKERLFLKENDQLCFHSLSADKKRRNRWDVAEWSMAPGRATQFTYCSEKGRDELTLRRTPRQKWFTDRSTDILYRNSVSNGAGVDEMFFRQLAVSGQGVQSIETYSPFDEVKETFKAKTTSLDTGEVHYINAYKHPSGFIFPRYHYRLIFTGVVKEEGRRLKAEREKAAQLARAQRGGGLQEAWQRGLDREAERRAQYRANQSITATIVENYDNWPNPYKLCITREKYAEARVTTDRCLAPHDNIQWQIPKRVIDRCEGEGDVIRDTTLKINWHKSCERFYD